MGTSKSELFSTEQNDLARIARALSHPARVAIIQHLIEVNSCIGGDIVDKVPLSQPTISRHLKELKDVGIVRGTIAGTRINYCIDKRRWDEIRQKMGTLLTSVINQDCA